MSRQHWRSVKECDREQRPQGPLTIKPYLKEPSMRHQPTRQQIRAFNAALKAVEAAPRLTPAYLAELERRRDQHLARLAY